MDVESPRIVDNSPSEPMEGQREEENDDTPALFVTTMPRNIWANPSLGALAALIDEDDEDEGDINEFDQEVPVQGGYSSTAVPAVPAVTDRRRVIIEESEPND